MSEVRLIAIVSVFLGVAGGGLAAERPEAVSPGEGSKLTLVESRCPTFSWSAVPGAEGYDLLVYRLPARAEEMVAVLRQSISGSASSWTPPVEHCLERGGHYGWLVRAVERGKRSDWSRPSLFSVAPGPSAMDFSEALGIVRRYLELSQTGDGAPVAATDPPGKPADNGREPSVASAAPSAVGSALGGADFSIDSAGNVLGASFAGDGSGLTGVDASSLEGEAGDFYRSWGNLTGVPAGFADGIDDNSDTLALLSCASGQVAKKTASGWACAGDDDTVAQLGCGADEVPQYTGAAWVCTALTVDNVGAVIPGAPTNVRVGPEHRFPGMRRCAWNMDSLAGVASFVVYQADFPITAGNKASAKRQVTTSLHAAVDLFPNSGTQYFRVEAQNVLGVAGPLSEEVAIDTTSRLAYVADQRFDEIDELFGVATSGGGSNILSDDPPLATMDVPYRGAFWSPAGSHLAYVADQDTDDVFELYVVPAAGGGAIKVNDPLADGGDVRDSSVRWSPDGSLLAYLADQDTDDVFELYVVPASGGGTTKVNDPLVDGRDVGGFSWSPDGSHLAYSADHDTDNFSEVYVVPAAGGGAMKVSDPPATGNNAYGALWSPDGSRLAYLEGPSTFFSPQELYVVSATGGGATKVNDPLVAGGSVTDNDFIVTYRQVIWSPDGSRLAYRADQDTDEEWELYVVAATGGGATKVNDPLVVGGDVGPFVWSPDGSRLAYLADQETDGEPGLYVVPAAGGGATRVSGGFARGEIVKLEFAWSPDGSRLAYIARENDPSGRDELYVVSATGGDATKVSRPLAAGERVGTSDVSDTDFAWSPDGSRLGYRSGQDSPAVFELYVVPATGGLSIKMNDTLVLDGSVKNFAWSPLGGAAVGTAVDCCH